MKNIWRRIAILICVLATVFILSACGKKCAVDGCENKPIKESDYCEEHTCAVEECLLSREVNSNYCNVHTCSMLNCYELVIDGSKCCQEHTCIVEGCFERGPVKIYAQIYLQAPAE